MMSSEPNRFAPSMSVAIAATARLRCRSTRKSSTGWSVRNAWTTNATSATPAHTALTVMPGSSNHCLISPRSRKYCSDARPLTSSKMPSTSTGRRCDADSRSVPASATTHSIPSGKLMKKISGQLYSSVSHPPTVGPRPGPSTAIIAKMPCATAARSFGNTDTRIACDVATRPPPNSPCNTRAATSAPNEVAMPHSMLASVNPTIENRKYRLRPKRSASQPVSGMTPIAASEYAVTTQPISSNVTPRLPAMSASATLTMVESRNCITAATLTPATMMTSRRPCSTGESVCCTAAIPAGRRT